MSSGFLLELDGALRMGAFDDRQAFFSLRSIKSVFAELFAESMVMASRFEHLAAVVAVLPAVSEIGFTCERYPRRGYWNGKA